jgi:hypothetical protein
MTSHNTEGTANIDFSYMDAGDGIFYGQELYWKGGEPAFNKILGKMVATHPDILTFIGNSSASACTVRVFRQNLALAKCHWIPRVFA